MTNYVVAKKYDLIKIDELTTAIDKAKICDLYTIEESINEDVESIPLGNLELMVNGSKRGGTDSYTMGKGCFRADDSFSLI